MENNYAMLYQGRTYDYGDWCMVEKALCFVVDLMIFGVAWLMFKPVDIVVRLRGKDEQ